MFNMNFSSNDLEILRDGVGAGYLVVYQCDFFPMYPLILKFYYLSFVCTSMNKEENKLSQICDNL